MENRLYNKDKPVINMQRKLYRIAQMIVKDIINIKKRKTIFNVS